MKTPVRSIIASVAIFILVMLFSEIFAGTEPPDPGGDPTGGGPPVGGGAPVGNGSFILIASGIVYISYKLIMIRRSILKSKD